VAVEFSAASLRLNASANSEDESCVLFVAADLHRLRLAPASYGVLMMADFLQYLGDIGDQRRFLHNVIPALAPGGRFYLSCLNYNVKNWWKGDRVGSFAGGAMPGTMRYRRSQVREVLAMLPDTVEVLAAYPINIFHNFAADRLAASLPPAFLLARMIVVTGRRRTT
jgi:SAM-dependent methyltransferase